MPSNRAVAVGVIAGVIVVGGGAAGAYAVFHTRGSPQETSEAFAAAWQRDDLRAMRTLVDSAPPAFDRTYREMRDDLGVERMRVYPGRVREEGDRATVSFTVTMSLKGAGDFSYKGAFPLRVHQRHWRIDWSPAAVHPALTGDRRFDLATRWPDRARIEDAGGGRMDAPDAAGSVRMLSGLTEKATAKQARKLGPAYRKGDAIGTSGLQKTFQERLAGTPGTEVRIVDADGEAVAEIGEKEPVPGDDLKTTLDPKVQRAAADAVRGQRKPTSLVALAPSAGEILAAANNEGGPGGWNRATEGKWAPGSTFKTVTAAALLADGARPGEEVSCPKYANVGGQRVRNSEHAEFGRLSLNDAFAHSCNTTFAPLTLDRLSPKALRAMAENLGFNQPLNPGVPAIKGSFPTPQSDAELGQASFGQARITASPLVMAGVAAAIADGTWRPPTLVSDMDQKAKERSLPDGVAGRLRPMMRAVVTKGTAKDAGLPDGTYAKTGTAEYGTGKKLRSHAWFHGFKGDVAFAVIVEDGGGGGKVAAPVAAKFLNGL